MSLSTSTTLAVVRDATEPAASSVAVNDQEVTWGKALISIIPTEILLAYTAGLGVVVALATSDPHAYLPFRFGWYVAWIVATPVVAWLLFRGKADAQPSIEANRVADWKALARPEIVAPTVAAAAWFTAMPGSPWEAYLSAGAFQLTALSALAGGVLIVSFLTPALTKPTSYSPLANR